MPRVYLIPTVLSEGRNEVLPSYILPAIKQCTVFFVENERTARRQFKQLWKEMVIDDYKWYTMKDGDAAVANSFRQAVKAEKTIGIISEAGCPGVADPGQQLVAVAQELNAHVVPLVGPSSILLALMASGMNGQHFSFLGYLPIDAAARIKAIRQAENDSRNKAATQIFIETPYRNNQLVETLVKTLQPQTQLCIAVDLTAETEEIRTRTVQQWKTSIPQLHKRPCIFLLHAAS